MKKQTFLSIAWASYMLAGLFVTTPAFSQSNQSFDQYITQVKQRASQKGIRDDILKSAFDGVEYKTRIVELDQKQPEGVWTFERYKNAVIPASRIQKGVELYKKYKDTITDINGGTVPPEFVIALWGMESDFGRNMGGYNVIEATATLAYEGRRRDFFEGELFAALEILNDGHISVDKMLGSFQGAMGNCQFMPTSYKRLSKDGDGDGKRDIWTNKKDVFASISNYLNKVGWQSNQRVGYLADSKADILALYQVKGGGRSASLDDTGAWKFTKYKNFDVLKKWNNSNKFAAAVGIFADEIKIRSDNKTVQSQSNLETQPVKDTSRYQWDDSGKMIIKNNKMN